MLHRRSRCGRSPPRTLPRRRRRRRRRASAGRRERRRGGPFLRAAAAGCRSSHAERHARLSSGGGLANVAGFGARPRRRLATTSGRCDGGYRLPHTTRRRRVRRCGQRGRNEVAVKSLLHGTLLEAHTANFCVRWSCSPSCATRTSCGSWALASTRSGCASCSSLPGLALRLTPQERGPSARPSDPRQADARGGVRDLLPPRLRPSGVHLDLKSANVLLDENGSAKVCDFGLSHVMEDAAVESGSSMGSPQWTAPEILRGQSYDQKADTYSYGVLLYEVMSRTAPYSGRDRELVVGHHEAAAPPRAHRRSAAPWPPRLPEPCCGAT